MIASSANPRLLRSEGQMSPDDKPQNLSRGAARLIARETLQMASVQEIKGYLVERYRDLGLINLVEMYR
jgi:hypothetical protein